jgi:phosphatidylserine/phosphatidylglycerophosphate/cardiolipin synthase-like enzyme
MQQNGSPRVFFGGGKRPTGVLGELLRQRVEAVPPGGAIDWVTYYFRDRRLAQALLRAYQRGVRVTVTIAAHPRTAAANRAVIAMLSGSDGLGRGFRALDLRSFFGSRSFLNPRLHEKLYCFSHPYPVALIGSFNPSGDTP